MRRSEHAHIAAKHRREIYRRSRAPKQSDLNIIRGGKWLRTQWNLRETGSQLPRLGFQGQRQHNAQEQVGKSMKNLGKPEIMRSGAGHRNNYDSVNGWSHQQGHPGGEQLVMEQNAHN